MSAGGNNAKILCGSSPVTPNKSNKLPRADLGLSLAPASPDHWAIASKLVKVATVVASGSMLKGNPATGRQHHFFA